MRQGQAVSFLLPRMGERLGSRAQLARVRSLQISFSDAKHGLIRTSTSLLFSVDGGANWRVVSSRQYSEDIKRFLYTLV